MVWPVGAMSRTTIPSSPAATVREGAEDGDLLGARRPEILLEQRPALLVELWADGRKHLVRVGPGLGRRIDLRLTVSQAGEDADRAGDVRSRSVVLRWTRRPRRASSTAIRGGDRGLPDAALSHGEDDAPGRRGRAPVDEGQQGRLGAGGQARAIGCRDGRVDAPGASTPRDAQAGQQRRAEQRAQRIGHGGERVAPPPLERRRDRVVAVGFEHGVHDEALVADAERRELRARPRRLRRPEAPGAPRAPSWCGPGPSAPSRGVVEHPLLLEAGEGPGQLVPNALLHESGPGGGEG